MASTQQARIIIITVAGWAGPGKFCTLSQLPTYRNRMTSNRPCFFCLQQKEIVQCKNANKRQPTGDGSFIRGVRSLANRQTKRIHFYYGPDKCTYATQYAALWTPSSTNVFVAFTRQPTASQPTDVISSRFSCWLTVFWVSAYINESQYPYMDVVREGMQCLYRTRVCARIFFICITSNESMWTYGRAYLC